MKRLLTSILMLLSVMLMQAQQVVHTVQRGETLESIAEKYHVTVDDIKKNNPDAAEMAYVGMKLVIPPAEGNGINISSSEVIESRSEESQQNGINSPSQDYSQINQNVLYEGNREGVSEKARENRKSVVFEIGYNAVTFDDVKTSGSYGFSVTVLPFNLVDELYAGLHFSPFNFNFGLVDSDFTSDIIKLGPAIGYYLTPTIFATLHIEALCEIYFKGTETKTNWGLSWAPSFYIGKKVGLYAGPQFTTYFKGDSKIYCGFRAGIYF